MHLSHSAFQTLKTIEVNLENMPVLEDFRFKIFKGTTYYSFLITTLWNKNTSRLKS